jgi:CRISPR-associated endonuclease/helicase Cas3
LSRFSVKVSTQTPAQRYLGAVGRLAGLFHDLGKASRAFLKKLLRGSGAEQLRHDLLSMLMLAQSLGRPDNDRQWLERLAKDPAAAGSCATPKSLLDRSDPLYTSVASALRGEPGAVLQTREQWKELIARTPALAAVLWLTLTHHRLPEGTASGEQLDITGYLNPDLVEAAGTGGKPRVRIASLDECLTPAPGQMPWQNAGWLQAVRSAAIAALAALDEMQARDAPLLKASASQWALLCAHSLRPNLIQADHLGSLLAQDTGPLRERAKTAPLANACGKGRAGDSLTTHLVRVGMLARRFQALSQAPHRFVRATLPADSPALQNDLPQRFAWQQKLARACAREAHRPTFVAVVAETGAGKTLGGLRAAHALGRHSLRLTMALSMRSLTWQAAQAVLADARLPAENLAVAVGQPQAIQLMEQAQRIRGSESAKGQEDDFALATFDADTHGQPVQLQEAPAHDRLQWLQGLCTVRQAEKLWGKKTLNLLAVPVLACTVDQLARAVTMLRGGDAKTALRLTTSDLLLDEIDSYSPQDLQTVGKLALMAGLGGRHLIVMSATAGPAVVEGLYRAWHRGLQLRGLMQPVEPARVLFCSHLGAPEEPAISSPELFASAWRAYTEALCSVYADDVRCPPRRRARMLDLVGCATQEDVFDRIFAEAVALHRRNHTVDARTGRRVSIGYVRLNAAKNAWLAARHLACMKSADQVEYKVLTYHGKYPATYLGAVEGVLRRMCTRKPGCDPLAHSPELRAVVDQARNDDILIIVCTTALIETGRDYDVDWEILEPRSTRSEVQSAGRARRHRPEPYDEVNVAILQWPLRSLDAGGKGVWAYPGIEDVVGYGRFLLNRGPDGWLIQPGKRRPDEAASEAPRVRKLAGRRVGGGDGRDAARPTALPVRTAAQALPLHRWQHKIDASACLLAPRRYDEDRLGAWEQHYQALHLTHGLKNYNARTPGLVPSLAWYLDSLAPLTRVHADNTRFRQSSGTQALVLPPRPGHEKAGFLDPASGRILPAAQCVNHVLESDRWLVPDLQRRAEALAQGYDIRLHAAALRVDRAGVSYTPLTWHPNLGFLEQHLAS